LTNKRDAQDGVLRTTAAVGRARGLLKRLGAGLHRGSVTPVIMPAMCRVHAERTVTRVGGLFLGKDLVSVENGQVVFGRAVADLAEALNPLGAAARIVAESCACITEMRRLNLEDRQLEAAKVERLANLEDRRVVVTASLHEMHTRVGQAELNARELRLSIDNMQRTLMKPNI
jgi:hypothetical protein